LIGYYLSQIIGTGVVFEATLGIPYSTTIIGMSIVFAIIASAAGSRTVTITDTIMMCIIAVGVSYIFSPMIISQVGFDKIAAFAAQEPVRYTGFGTYHTWMSFIGVTVLWAFGNAANPSAITRCYLVKDDRSWLKVMMLVCAITFSVIWLVMIASSSIAIVNTEIKPTSAALAWASRNMVGPVIGATAVAGLMGACISTATTQILTVGVSVARDIVEKRSTVKVSDKTLILIARVVIFAVAIVGIPLSLGQSSYITMVGQFGSSVFAAAFAPALFLGLFWKRMTRQGAISSMVVGLVFDLVLHFGGVAFGNGFGDASWLPFKFHPALFSVIIAFVVAWAVSLRTSVTEPQLAVYTKVATPDVNPQTSDASMKRAMILFGIYIVVQTVLVFVFADLIA
jgi:Na+/proline symporter